MGRVRREAIAYREAKRKRLINEQGNRCPICDNEIDHGSSFYELEPGGLIVHQACWGLYRHALKYKGFVLDRVLELVNKGYIGNKPPDGDKVA